MPLSWSMDRERAWLELHSRGFTPDDVRLVVRWLKWGIKRGEAGHSGGRNPGCLRFRNFTAPDQFEEDLLFAREKMKRQKSQGSAAAPAPVKNPAAAERVTADDLAAAKAALK